MNDPTTLSGSAIFDRFVRRYESERATRDTISEERLLAQQTAKKLKKTQGLRILDAACGTGIRWEKRRRQHTLVGLDGSAEMLKIASASGLFNQLIQVDLNDPSDYPVEPNSFDLVICKDTLIYIPDTTRIIRGLLEAVKPNAFMYLNFYIPLLPLEGTRSFPRYERMEDKESGVILTIEKWVHSPEKIKEDVGAYGSQLVEYRYGLPAGGFIEHGMTIQKRRP